MRVFIEHIIVWFIGGVLYGLIEILYRGYTHWSMVLTGGICFLIIYKIADFDSPHLLCALASASAITAIEFAVGVIVNLRFNMNVWDYSDRLFNLFGQICPLYTFFWFVLCLVAIILCRKIKAGLNKKPV